MKRNQNVKLAKGLITSFLTVTLVVTNIPCMTLIHDNDDVIVTQAAETSNYVVDDIAKLYNATRTDFRDETIYSVMITRFYDGDTGNNVHCWDDVSANNPDSDPAWRGDFKGLIDKLDYIKALGFTAIRVTPVAKNASGYDYRGYHAINLREVDPRLESDGYTYEDFIEACHRKDMKVIQTVVINDTGNFGEENLNFLFDKIDNTGEIKNDIIPTDKFLTKFGLASVQDYYAQTPLIQYQQRISILKEEGVAEGNIYHSDKWNNFSYEDYTLQVGQLAGDCVDLNTENPVVYNYLVDVFEWYIEKGVDAFVIDKANCVSRLTYNKVLNEAVAKAAKDVGKEIPIFGLTTPNELNSIWNSNYQSISVPFYTWKDEEIESQYEWSDTEWETNLQSAIKFTQDNSDIQNANTSDNSMLDGLTYHEPDYSKYSGMSAVDQPFYISAMNAQYAFESAEYWDKYYNDATWNMTYIDDWDYAPDRGYSVFDWSELEYCSILSLMFTFRGIPSVTYGAEVQFQKGTHIDVGPNMPLSMTRNAYFGDYIDGTVRSRTFGSYSNVSGAIETRFSEAIVKHIQSLNRLRQAIPALRKGQYTTSNEYVEGDIAYIKRYTDETTDSLACVAVSGGAKFKNIPNGKYIDAVTGIVCNVSNGVLQVPSSSMLSVYVWDNSTTKAPGCVVPSNTEYLKGGASRFEAESDANVEAERVVLNASELELSLGESYNVIATVEPNYAINKTVSWMSSNPNIVKVEDGMITAIAQGEATITAITSNGLSDTVIVKVKNIEETSKPDEVVIKKGWIYIKKPAYWGEQLSAYSWDDSNSTLLGQWPGSLLTKVTDDIYGIELPEGARYIIFNDGVNQTADLEIGTNNCYDGATSTWGMIEITEEDEQEETTTSSEEESTQEITTVPNESESVQDNTTSPEETSAQEESKTQTEESTKVIETTTAQKETTTTVKKVVKPARVKIISAHKKRAAKIAKINVKKIKKVAGYQVQFSSTKKFKKILVKKLIKKVKTNITNKKFKKVKRLYVRVRAYRLKGKIKVWGYWSKVKRVTIKK